MLALPPAPVVTAAGGGDGTVAVALAQGTRVRLVVRSGALRTRTFAGGVGPVSEVFTATDERGRTTVAWDAPQLGGRLAVRAATVDWRDRLLAPPSTVALKADMRPVTLTAGRGRAMLVVDVFDNLQAASPYCTFGGASFAGANYFATIKTARGAFPAATSIGTGDAYAGSAFLPHARILSADTEGDVAGWPIARRGCTRWRPQRLAGARRMRSAVALAGAADGTVAWVGQDNAGSFTPTGDEASPPPRPAPGRLTAVVIGRGPARVAGFGRGASPAVAALPGGRAAFAWLDEPAPGGFGGSGRRLPSRLWLAALGGAPQAVATPLADPAAAAPPQVAAGADGTVAVLEAAGRYRLGVRHAGGALAPTRDLGTVGPGNVARVFAAGRAVYLLRQTAAATRISRLR